jgi:hypothetical protein
MCRFLAQLGLLQSDKSKALKIGVVVAETAMLSFLLLDFVDSLFEDTIGSKAKDHSLNAFRECQN